MRHAAALSKRLTAPPFLIGITLVALGTDMPELVNSIVSCRLGHGNINVGDSIGSVFAQGTLVLGLLPFVARAAPPVRRREVLLTSGLTLAALLLGVVLVRDGTLSRLDGLLLSLVWVAATGTAWRFGGAPGEPPPRAGGASGSAFGHAAKLFGALAVVAAAAAGLVHAVAAASAALAVPEYVVGFFGAALGTSLPELVVDLTAMRRGQKEIALGGVLGACLIDATLSLGIGPALFPTPIDAELALRGAAVAFVAMASALMLGSRVKHDRWSGAALIALYVCGYFLLIPRP
ncbi:MAG: hypothetical protein KGM24_04685 [Elusimicrobia bacterium]|nr:hypothetical protein [Elusimicrobiota bacterium]